MKSTGFYPVQPLKKNIPGVRRLLPPAHVGIIPFPELLNKFNIEKIIHLGDAIGIGPCPIETLECLMALNNCKMVLGNHENYQITKLPEDISEEEFRHQSWIKELLTEKHLNWIKTFPKIISEEYGCLKISFLHSIYDERNNDFTNIPYKDTDKLEKYFNDIESEMIFYGHTHIKYYSRGNKKYYNPGAAGCSKNNEIQFIILTVNETEYKIENICINYNKRQLLKEFNDKKVPGKDEIIKIFY
jgi:predicted phosphodiesterase